MNDLNKPKSVRDAKREKRLCIYAGCPRRTNGSYCETHRAYFRDIMRERKLAEIRRK